MQPASTEYTLLRRLAGQLAQSGGARSTQGDRVTGATDLPELLDALMHRRLLQFRALHGDDTFVKVPGSGAAGFRRRWLSSSTTREKAMAK